MKQFKFSIETELTKDNQLKDKSEVKIQMKGTTLTLTALLTHAAEKNEDLNAAIVSAALKRIDGLPRAIREEIALKIISGDYQENKKTLRNEDRVKGSQTKTIFYN